MPELNKAENKKGHILWIDGLKGIAALGILMHHMVITAYPAAYSGDAAAAKVNAAVETFFAQSPLAFFLNGNFYMFLFLFLSGYVMALQAAKCDTVQKFLRTIYRRYLRLAIPLFFACLFTWILFRAGLLKENAFPNGAPTFLRVITCAFFRILIFGDQTFGGALVYTGILCLVTAAFSDGVSGGHSASRRDLRTV